LHPALVRIRRIFPGIRSCGLPDVLRKIRRGFLWHPYPLQPGAWAVAPYLREPGRLLGFDPFDWMLLLAGVLIGFLILFI